MKQIPIIVVGLGQWGKLWVEDILSDAQFEIVGLVDNKLENIDFVCESFGIARDKGYSSIEQVVSAHPPGVAVLTVPPKQHFEVASGLINAGYHILSEKPLASNFNEALKLRDLAERSSVYFMVSQDYRWQPPIQTLRHLLNENKIGDLGYASYQHYVSLKIGGWREKMDHVILEDMSIHHFDIIRAITGVNCVKVYAESINPVWSWYKGGAVTSVQLLFENNFFVNYFATWVTNGPENSWPGEIRIEGKDGTLIMDSAGNIMLYGSTGSNKIPWLSLEFTGRKFALNEMRNALSLGISPETTIQDNLQSFAIIQASLLSVKEKRLVEVVEIINGE